jgi:hypothetical protein
MEMVTTFTYMYYIQLLISVVERSILEIGASSSSTVGCEDSCYISIS